MSATLMAHCGAEIVTRDVLALYEPPEATKTWKPIAHAELVDTIHEEIASRGLVVRKEQYAVQSEGALLFGIIDLEWEDNGEYAAALGLRTSNNKKFPIQMVSGFRVFVCDNLSFAGEIIALRRKHTKKLDLRAEIGEGIDRYQAGVLELSHGIDRMKNMPVNPVGAKEAIFDIFKSKIVPTRLFHPVVAEWQKVTAETGGYGTEWMLMNAVTEHIKVLRPGVAFDATRKLGEYFQV